MNPDIEEFVLEDNKTYISKGNIIYNGKNYYLLIDESNFSNIKICYRDFADNAFIQITDGEILNQISPLLEEAQRKVATIESAEDNN